MCYNYTGVNVLANNVLNNHAGGYLLEVLGLNTRKVLYGFAGGKILSGLFSCCG